MKRFFELDDTWHSKSHDSNKVRSLGMNPSQPQAVTNRTEPGSAKTPPSLGKVLLLNPPAEDLLIRDNYCSKTTKSNVIPQPLDLIMQTGRLAEHFEIDVLDCIVTRTSFANARERILRFQPDVIFFLSGAISWMEDFPFLESVKKELGGKTILVGTGDIFLEDGERWLVEHPFINAVIGDFSNNDVVNFLLENDDDLENIVYYRNTELRKSDNKRIRKKLFEMPQPQHDFFQHPDYHFSFVRKKPWATVMTDFGCPYPCTFCVQSMVGSKYRSVESIMEELRGLHQRGIREIFFHDQTWGIHRQRNLDLCAAMVKEDLGMGWTTFTRVDIVDEEVLRGWKAAGCHTLMFGVEFASPDMLKQYRKGYKPDQIISGLNLTRKLGIRTVGTFLLGLPEETRETLEATIDLACDLPLDFASFNVAVPRHGTPLRGEAKDKGLITDETVMDQSGAYVLMPTNTLSRDEVSVAKTKANRKFYLRPSYLLRRLLSLRSWREFRWQVSEGWALLARNK